MPAKKSKYGAYNISKTSKLADLRQGAGLSQAQAAEYLGLPGKKSRDAISQWETGHSRPAPRHRSRLISYLWEKLKLRDTPQQFSALWEDVMVGEWKWPSIIESELPDVVPNVLPHYPNPPQIRIIGRDNFLAELKQKLHFDVGPIAYALYGKPGAGKTTLARALIHDPEMREYFRDGILWANIGKNGNALTVLDNWATSLKIPREETKPLKHANSKAERIIAEIGNRRMLLVIDDVWQEDLAVSLKLGCPNCAHLLTTRLPGVAYSFTHAHDNCFPVPELETEASEDLIRLLAPRVFELEPARVKAILAAVDGLPLSLILIGHFLEKESGSNQPRRILQAVEKLTKAEERLRLNESQPPLEGHTTLQAGAKISVEAIIAISDEALNNASRATLRALSIFPPKPNSFSEEAALEISAQNVDTLDKLWDYGLLEMEVSGRYNLHSSIAEYAQTRLTDPIVYKRLVNYYLYFLETHDTADDEYDLEHTNVLTALDVAYDQDMQSSVVKGSKFLYGYMESRGFYITAEKYLRRGVQNARFLGDDDSLAILLLRLGAILEREGEYTQAKDCFQEGLGIATAIDNKEVMSSLLSSLGALAYKTGDTIMAESFMIDGLLMARQTNDTDLVVLLLGNLGGLNVTQGNHSGAESYLLEAEKLASKVMDRTKIMAIYINLGVSKEHQGDYASAEQYYRNALQLSYELGHRPHIAKSLLNLGIVFDNRGNHEEAEASWIEGLKIAREIRQPELISVFLANLGYIFIERGDYLLAQAQFEEALEKALKIQNADRISMSFEGLGVLANTAQEYKQAEDYFEKALWWASKLNHALRLCNILNHRCRCQLQQGKLDSALASAYEARVISRQAKLKEYYAEALFLMAQIEFVQRNIPRAHRLAHKSICLFDAIENHKAMDVKSWLIEFPG